MLNGRQLQPRACGGPGAGGVLIASLGAARSVRARRGVFPRRHGRARRLAAAREATERALGAEHVVAAHAGRRAVRPLGAALAAWCSCGRGAVHARVASALWALLPVVARGPARARLGRLRALARERGGPGRGGRRLSPARAALPAWWTDTLVGSARCSSAGEHGGGRRPCARCPSWLAALVVAGLCWIAVLSSLNASAQTLLPAWTRARGLRLSTRCIFMGGQAIGSVVWGGLASTAGLAAAHTVAGLGPRSVGALFGHARVRLGARRSRREPSRRIGPSRTSVLDRGPRGGARCSCRIELPGADRERVRPSGKHAPVGRRRRRAGAERWGLFRDARADEPWVETFLVATWEETCASTGSARRCATPSWRPTPWRSPVTATPHKPGTCCSPMPSTTSGRCDRVERRRPARRPSVGSSVAPSAPRPASSSRPSACARAS